MPAGRIKGSRKAQDPDDFIARAAENTVIDARGLVNLRCNRRKEVELKGDECNGGDDRHGVALADAISGVEGLSDMLADVNRAAEA